MADERFPIIQLLFLAGARKIQELLNRPVPPEPPWDQRTVNERSPYTPHEEHIILLISLSLSCVGLVTVVLATYWLLLIAKHFRHDLMVMMFLGNLLRALAFILYPMVFWDEGKAGKIPCLAIGFLFADGDTATDIANLLLAIHMALQVFLPSASPETAGLAPYTTTVFLFWIFFPVLMASLAFINGDNAFSNQGTGCVLPVRPFSYRLALAWIPRYIILTTITVITASVYVYVVYIGRNLGQELASLRRHGTAPWDVRLLEQTPEGEEMTGASSPSGEPLKPLPRLVLRGLIPSTSYDLHDDVKTPVIKPLNEGVKLTESELGPRVFSDRDERLQWQLQHSSKWGNLSASASPPNPFGPSELLVQSPQTLQEVSLDVRLVNSHGTFYINATEPCRSKDQPPLPQALAPGYLPSSCLPSSQLLTMVDDSAYDDLPRASHLRTHRQIRKQTRLLFIYPLVYLLTSIVPLIAHCFQYSDYYVEHPNFTLSCFAAAATSVQCALECACFIIMERPWRQIEGRRQTWWSSLKLWTKWTTTHARDHLRVTPEPRRRESGSGDMEQGGAWPGENTQNAYHVRHRPRRGREWWWQDERQWIRTAPLPRLSQPWTSGARVARTARSYPRARNVSAPRYAYSDHDEEEETGIEANEPVEGEGDDVRRGKDEVEAAMDMSDEHHVGVDPIKSIRTRSTYRSRADIDSSPER